MTAKVPYVQKACPRCGAAYEHKPSIDKKFCGEVCARAAATANSLAKRRRECAQCGTEFFAVRAHWKTRCCSARCARALRVAENILRRPRRQCPQCGDTFQVFAKRPDQIYCGDPCYHASKKGKLSAALQKGHAVHSARSVERRTKQCEECRGEYVVAQGWWDGHRRARFCSDECRVASAARKIAALLAQGKPIIEVYDTYVLCLVCGKKLEQAGTHFTKIHGLGTTKDTGAANGLGEAILRTRRTHANKTAPEAASIMPQ